MSAYPIRSRRVAPPKWFDLARLQELRDRHARLRSEYLHAAEAARGADKAVVQMRASATAMPEFADMLQQPTDKLLKLTMEQLAEIHLDVRAVQRIVIAETRAKAARDAMGALALRMQASSQYMQRVEAFAKQERLDL